MKFFVSLLLSIVLLTFPLLVQANKIVTLKQNQPAPFGGHLVDSEALLRLRQGKVLAEKVCALETSYAIKNAKIDSQLALSLCQNNLKSTQQRLTAIINLQNKEIVELRKTALKNSNPNLIPLWITVGIVVGVGMTVAVIFAIKPIVATNP